MNPLVRRAAIGSAATVLLISGFAAVSQAQSSSPSPSPSSGAKPSGAPASGAPGDHRGGRGHFGGPGGFGGFGFARGLVHGEGVVKDKDGKYVTESVQTGKASAVSATAVTVTSDDGFTRTYVLDKDTKGTAKDAATVTVIALKSGSSWTAQRVVTPGDRPQGGFGPGGHGPGDHRPGQPKPSASASASPTTGA